jgi:hypothetical protein
MREVEERELKIRGGGEERRSGRGKRKGTMEMGRERVAFSRSRGSFRSPVRWSGTARRQST